MPVPGAAKKLLQKKQEQLPPIEPPEVDPVVWEEQERLIYYEDEDVKKKVQCRVYGSIAVKYSDTDKKWHVIHTRTWHDICWTDGEDSALQIGTYLWENCCLIWRYDNPDEVRQAAPQWVKEWTKACREAGKWLDPQWYQTEYPS